MRFGGLFSSKVISLNNQLRMTKLAIFDLNPKELLQILCHSAFMFRLVWIVICFIWIICYVKPLIIHFSETTGYIEDWYLTIANNEKIIACFRNIWKIQVSIENKDDDIYHFVYADTCMRVKLKFLVDYFY